MINTRVVNGIEYVIPPETEHVWTPPEQVVVTPPPLDIPATELIDQLGLQKMVREQDPDIIQSLIDKLRDIWGEFDSKAIDATTFAQKLADFRNNDLNSSQGPHEFDDFTVQAFEHTMAILMNESTK